MKQLDDALCQAHASGDDRALARLYQQAADAADARGDEAETRFFLTQAYVFALASGAPETGPLNRRLAALGAEVIQDDFK